VSGRREENDPERDAAAKSKPRLNCLAVNRTRGNGMVEVNQVFVLNGTEFQLRLTEDNIANVTNRTFPGVCSVTFFYASWCDFSATAAASFNAVPRFFPGVNFYAIESTANHNIYAQFGVIALPTILVFHNSRQLYRFNHSEHSLDKYIEYVKHLTGIQPENISMAITEQDYRGPLPTVAVKTFNFNLLLATLFLVACALVELSKSTYFHTMIDNLRNAWREAEIQHEHAD